MTTLPIRGDLESKIPLDVVCSIVQYCSKKALCSTSLVCKSWLPISQVLLFRRVVINVTDLLDKYIATTNILLRSGSNAASHIQHIVFELKSDNRSALDDSSKRMYDNMHHLVRSLKGQVDGMRKLSLNLPLPFTLCYPTLPDSQIQKLVPSISSVFNDILELDVHSYKANFRDLLQFICSFPRLEALHITCFDVMEVETLRNEDIQIGCTLPSSLRVFHFEVSFRKQLRDNEADYIQWISSHPARPSISHLSLFPSFGSNLGLNAFSRLCLRTMKSLYIGVYSKRSPILTLAPEHLYNLSSLISLETLVTDMPPIIPPRPTRRMVALQAAFVISQTVLAESGSSSSGSSISPAIATTPYFKHVQSIINLITSITSPHFRKLSLIIDRAQFPRFSDPVVSESTNRVRDGSGASAVQLRSEAWRVLDDFLSSYDRFPDLVLEIIVTPPVGSRVPEDWQRVAIDEAKCRFVSCDLKQMLLISFPALGVKDTSIRVGSHVGL
ncbi:hypothetical protein L218DRAFT_1081904 [Marasmius fiardii PR-910]|nr:hypothetical protein L218DRAFT_1081904 [Marasmius fiardii PR-910]